MAGMQKSKSQGETSKKKKKMDKKTRELKRLSERIRLLIAERDLLDSSIPIETVVEQRFDWDTEREHQQIIERVREFRTKGKVNWNSKIERHERSM